MNVNHESNKIIIRLEVIKWISAIVFIVISIIGNYLYRDDYSSFIRGVVVFVVIMIAMYILSLTNIGKRAIVFGNESRIELRKVIWPTYRDGLQTTLIVTAVTVIMSLIIWGLDTILVHVISFGLRL